MAKREQILCVTSCEFDECAASQNLLLEVDPLSTIRNNKLIKQGERLETSAKLRVFVSEHIVAVYKSVIYEIRISACIQRKFGGVYSIKNHRTNLLFSYCKLGFRCFEPNLFSFALPFFPHEIMILL